MSIHTVELSTGDKIQVTDGQRVGGGIRSHHHELTIRQQKYLQARLDGKTKSEAKSIANYSHNVSFTDIENKKNLKDVLLKSMEKVGLTEDYLSRKLIDGTNAKKLLLASFEGKFTDEREVEDKEVQHRYLKTIHDIRGDISDRSNVNVSVGLVQVPDVKEVDSWNSDVT